MPAKFFRCPDSETIEIEKCLQVNGCRMRNRCATRPFLRLIGYDRKWKGVTPSSAGNGPRMLYLKATVDYVIEPERRVFAVFGTGTHEKLSSFDHTEDVLSEETLKDKELEGIADCLDHDEQKPGYYILTDYKTGASYKVTKWLGIVSEKTEETLLDDKGKPILLKSGKNMGQPKTKIHTEIIVDPTKVDIRAEELQLNRYRILFERHGFPISKMQIQSMPRDGGTYLAKNRGITQNLYMIPIKRLLNDEVLSFYKELANEVTEAFRTGYARKCNAWENWERRRCDNGYCEIQKECIEMSKQAGEKWGIL